jgi:heme/copper-type cytochrome/quinol oxidase subunit 4
MAIIVDLADLERSYRNMSEEEFASVKRENLTTEGAKAYDAEAAHRSTPEWKAANPHVEELVIDLESPAHRRMARHVTVIAFSSLLATLWYVLAAISQLVPKGNPRIVMVSFLPVILGFLLIFFGLRRRKRWGRTLAIVWAALLIYVPFSWYVLWVLTRTETRHLFGLTSPTLDRFFSDPYE